DAGERLRRPRPASRSRGGSAKADRPERMCQLFLSPSSYVIIVDGSFVWSNCPDDGIPNGLKKDPKRWSDPLINRGSAKLSPVLPVTPPIPAPVPTGVGVAPP